MAERYGPLLASFQDPRATGTTIITFNGVSQLGGIESAEIHKALGQMPRGRMTLLPSTGWEGLVVEGRIVSLYQLNGVSDASGNGLYREMGAFVAQSAKERLLKDGRRVIEARGLGPEHLLTKIRHWEAIGKETIYSTALTALAPAPFQTTLTAGVPHGNDSAVLASKGFLDEGDELRIQMDNGDWFRGHIRNPNPSGTNGVVQYDPRNPGDATQGNAAEGRKARLAVGNLTGLASGQRVSVRLNDNSVHTTLIREVDLGALEIVLEEGLPSAAAIGKQVWAYDYSEPALDDVMQILAPAAGWTVEFQEAGGQGTRAGSAHAPVGESVWDLLTVAAERNGEYFRMAAASGGFLPRRRLRWMWQPEPSGMVLYLRDSSVDVAADTENINRGVIHSMERERESDLITRVYPISGDGRIDLEYLSEEALLRAAVEGFTAHISDDLFVPDHVEFGPGVAAHGVLEAPMRYGNVSLPKKASLNELRSAADGMLYQAMTTILESQAREYWRVEVHCHRPLWPGQTVQVVNQALEPKTTQTYYVLEVTERYSGSGPASGVIMSSLLLSREMQLRPTAAVKMGRQMKADQMAARRLILSEGAEGASVVSGGGGGTPGPHEHGEFLRVDGTRALVGNMAVNPGVTVDGVDISAHAADPAAHHAPVSAGDGSVLVEGQAVRVNPAIAGAGLAMAAGVMAVQTSAALGTTISSDAVGVWADPAGGLMVAGTGVMIRRPVNSGLKLSAAGAEIVPARVGAKTTNSVTLETHTHEGFGVVDSKATPGELMKTDASGDHRLRWLNADKLRAPIWESESGPITADPFDGKFYVDGDVVLTGAGRAIRSAVGQGLLIAPAGRLLIGPGDGVAELQPGTTLRTQHHASGFLGTGWEATYDGEIDARKITADELIVQTFIADVARVRVGSLWVTPGAALLAEAFTIPAVGSTTTMIVEDAPGGLANMPVFDSGDWVMVRVLNRAGGGLIAGLAWGQVTNYADGPGPGQQSWTFTTRSTSAAGQMAAGGDEVLGFGKSGAGWVHATTTDAAGSPYLGMTIWRGDNPYTDANRLHMLRLGQIRGVTGVWEWGLHVGQVGGRRLRWSELAAEIHGARLSLYAGDGAQVRVRAAAVQLNSGTLVPNADGVATNVINSGGGAYWSHLDEPVDTPAADDWVANGLNSSGQLSVGLTDPVSWGAIGTVKARAALQGVGFSSDSIRLYAQVVAADEVTPLTSEERLATFSSNVGMVTEVILRPDVAATQAQWNGARLRLRWDYSIGSAKEAIRLDPQIPSIAVGMGLPTGADAGGDGFWVGAEAGVYKLRLGKAVGVGLRWDGAQLSLRNSANQDVIRLLSDGTSEFARAMTLGPAGGIWQGTGTFDAPGTGLKLWRDGGGIGRLSSFNAGLEQMTLNSSGQLVAGAGGVVIDRTGLRLVNSLISSTPGHPSAVRFYSGAASADYVNLHGYAGGLRMATIKPGAFDNELVLSHGAGALGSNLFGMFNKGVELTVRESATATGVSLFMQAGFAAFSFGNPAGGYVGVGGSLSVLRGLAVGTETLPAPGRILMANSTGPTTVPPGCALLFLEDSAGTGGKQVLYIRFADGTYVKLAQSAVD